MRLASTERLRVLLPVLAAVGLISFLGSGLVALVQGVTVLAVINLVLAVAWAVVIVLFLVEGRRRRSRERPPAGDAPR